MEGIRSEIFGHLDDHVADMGFLAYAEPMNYEWTPLAEEAVIAVVPETHRLAGAKAYPISLVQANSGFRLDHQPRTNKEMVDKYIQ